MSDRPQPKVSFRDRLANGDFLTLTVWAGKSDPKAEVITAQIRHLNGDVWETIGRLAAYRTADGNYSQLPERRNRTTETSDQKTLPPPSRTVTKQNKQNKSFMP